MFMDRIKNWLKSLALWVWVHFITLLASDPDSVPKLKYVTEEDGIIILADETTDVDKIKSKEKKKKKLFQNVEEGIKEQYVIEQSEEANLEKENALRNKEISEEENERNLDENVSLKKSQLEDEEEKEVKDEEDDIPWLGVGRGAGLTRYSGIQNLLDTTSTAEELLITEKKQPVLLPKRDGSLVLQRPSFGRSLIHEKDRLSEIPEEEKQSPPSFTDGVSNDSDKLWASLVARYGKEDEEDEISFEKDVLRKKDHITDAEGMQQPIFTSPEESISTEEFSNQVEERLQRYLAKIDEQNMLDEDSGKIENFVDETETMEEGTMEIDEYEVDTTTFDENGRLGNENKIFILIEDDDSNEEKEENTGRKYDEELMSDDNFSAGKSEMEPIDYRKLKAISEEDEAISDYDVLQFDSSSNLITNTEVSLTTELQPLGNETESPATFLESELKLITTEGSPDYFKQADDDYQENISDEEDIIEEKTAVFTISLHKKPDTSLSYKTDNEECTQGKSSVVDHESPIVINNASNVICVSNSEEEEIELDPSSEFLTKERRQSRDLWKLDCEKFLGEQESPQEHSLEEREDFIFTTYDEFPEDCVPVAEGLFAIAEKFGIPLEFETPKEDEEEDSIVDSVFEEPIVLLDSDEFNITCSEVVSDETNAFRDDELTTVEKQEDTAFSENLDKNNFWLDSDYQKENFITANVNKIFYEPLEFEANNLLDVTGTDKFDITVEDSFLKSITSGIKYIDTDQENVTSIEQYGEKVSSLDDVITVNQEAYPLDMSDNVEEEDAVDDEIKDALNSDYEEMKTSIKVELIQEICFSPVLLLEKHLSAGREDGEDYTVALLEGECADKDQSTENAPSLEYLLEKVIKEEPVLDIKYHVICDIDMDDSTFEKTGNLKHSMLEEHVESILDDSQELETVIESKLIQILDQMEEEPEKIIDAESNCEVAIVCADKEKSVYQENITAEKSNIEFINTNIEETSHNKKTIVTIPVVNEASAPSSDNSYKPKEAAQPSNEEKKKIATKVKKGKLDNILKRFEEKEEPILKKPLLKKRFGVRDKETKPTMEEIENASIKDHELSSEQKDTSFSDVSDNKEKLLEKTTEKSLYTKILSPIGMEEDKVEALLEETSVFTQDTNCYEIDVPIQQVMLKEGISEIQTSKDKLINKSIFSTDSVIGELTKLADDEKSLENQPVFINALVKNSFTAYETEKLKEVIMPEKNEIGDSLCTNNEGNFESSFKQSDAKGTSSEPKAESATVVLPPSDNIVTVTIPKRKKLLIPKNFEETSEPKQMVKAAVKKGKLDNILKRFEEKESKPVATKASSKLDVSSKKGFAVKLEKLEESSNNQFLNDVRTNNQLSLDVQAEELKTQCSFAVDNKEVEKLLSEKQGSTNSEVVNESIGYEHDGLKTFEKSTLDSKIEYSLSSMELGNEHIFTVKFKDVPESTTSLKSEADTYFTQKLLDETPLEHVRSDILIDEKDKFIFKFKNDTGLLNKEKSTSLLDLGTENRQEKFLEDDESYYVLDEIKQQQAMTNTEDIDVNKEKSYWFDDKENLREAENLSERKTSEKDDSTFWFEEDTKQQEGNISSFWFEENEANNVQEESVPIRGAEDIICKDETLTEVDTIETKKRHSYFSEEDDDLYFLRKSEGEKPFTEEKDEELALLRKETMELSKPKKFKKDYEDNISTSDRLFSENLKSCEISEEDRLEKEQILRAIRSEREVSKSGLIPEEEIPDYLDDVKDLLVPKVRRKKGRRNKALDDLMKVDEPDFAPKAIEVSEKDMRDRHPLTTKDTANVESKDALRSQIAPEFSANENSEPISNKFLTKEEERELIEIQREQEALRASQRKELEKYLSMPAALTEQEQQELEELLADEETDRTVNAVSEARLEALLNEVRKRIGDSELDLDTAAALEEYIGLPIGLSVEEELLLSNVGEEKDRSQFASEDEYRDYIKQRYLDELENERMRVEEDEYEFGGYYEDDYEYDGDEDYDEELMDEDYDLMESDNAPHTLIMKDEAVGGDEPIDLETGDLKKSSLSSLRSKGSKSSSGSLDKQGSNYSSKEGSSSDLQKESSHTQSKKFFRYGGLSKKRKKKSKNYSEIDPGIKNEGLAINELCKQNCHNVVYNSVNNGNILISSFLVDNESNKNENSSCDSDEAFVVISKDICKSITNLCCDESFETVPPCQDLRTNKITYSGILNSPLLNEPNSNNELKTQKSKHFEKVSKMSEVTSGPDAVSVLEEDSLEYQSPAADVMSAASNFAQGPPTYPLKPDHSSTHTSNQMSLQELIEAELNSRLAPLQPDSLEGGLPDYHEHIRTTVINGDVTATCASLLDSLEASPFSLDSLVDVESGVDPTSPPNPALGGSPPSPYSPFIHNSSSNQTNNINLNGQQNSNHTNISENQTAINSDTENDFVIFESLPSKEVNDLKTENLIENIMESNVTLDLNESANTEVKDIAESNNIILIDEDDNTEDVEHVVVENISFEINTTSETVLESHCLQNDITNGFEQKAERSLIEHKTVEKQLYNVKEESLIEVSKTSEEKFKTCNVSDVDRQELKSKPIDDISETNFDGTNSLDKFITTPAYDLIVNDFHELEQPKKASSFDKFYQADSFSDFKIGHFSKSESVDESTTVSQQSEVVSRKISNVDFLETIDPANDPNESNNFSQSEDSKLNNFSQSEGIKLNNFSQSESLSMETSHKLIKNIVDVSNSYNIIDIINNKDVAVYNNSLLPADVHVANMDETELWPEEEEEGENGKKEEMDEFQKMEREVEREMEEEQKKKKKSGTDKRGKKKKKRKGESEKENKKTAYQSKDELYEKHVGPRIRSFDPAKMKSKFNKPKEPTQVSNDCRICGKLVFQMEKIVAEKASWHKNCFRCIECNKNLTLETYQSHEGSLYCKPHFKELFRPKAVVQDEAEERKDRLLRRPRMIILESQPDILPDDVVRATEKPDYGLEELQTSLNVKERFAVFESYSKAADEPKLEPVSVRRSQSLMSKAARFSNGHQNGDLEDEEEEYESVEEMEDEVEEGEEGDPNYVKSRKKKERPMSFSGMGDLKAVWEQKQRREEMTQARKEDISKFRQMLCAGKNITLKEMFESGNFEGADDEDKRCREEIKIEDRRAAHNLKARFEKGQPFILEDEEGSEDGSRTITLVGEKLEVEEVFKDAQTAKRARNVFKQIDSKVIQEGSVMLRSPSFAAQNRDNRRSLDISLMMPQRSMSTAEVVKSSEPVEEELQVDTTDLANRFKFFATFEERQKEEKEKKRKVFRITPPREGAEQVEETLLKANIKPCMAPNCTVCKLRGLSHGSDDLEVLGRDPNLIKCTDNYQDEIDCRNTKNILQMFKKMEMGEEEEEEGPRPLKCFTPPPEDGDGDESEYSDEEYSDEGEDDETEEDDDGKPKFKDELLEMEACPQSARKAANLRAKFEKWEVEEQRKNDHNRDKDSELEEECRPSLDTTRNLKAMFEHKAIEVTKPVTSKPVAQKINRFVGVCEKCMACDKTVYAMERLEIHGKILHKNCFKCFKCKSRLSMGSFSFGGEHMFCTTHYKQLFTEKGSYDAFLSGKVKWTSKIEATNAEAIKSHD